MDIDSEISAIENLAIEGPENSLEVPAIGGLSTSRLGEECAGEEWLRCLTNGVKLIISQYICN